MKQELMKMPKWIRKPIFGVVMSVIVLVSILLAFSLALNWPTSLITLGIMLGVAWFLAAGVGGKIEEGKWSGVVATLLVVGLVVSTLGFGVPWNLKFAGSQGTKENVIFRMEASFTYLGSENNLPIENVAIRFPCPNIENKIESFYWKHTWSLYWIDTDNTVQLQATENQIYGFLGNRTDKLNILLYGTEPTNDGPKITYVLDKLYQKEIFKITVLIMVSSENDVNKLTIRNYNDNMGRSSGAFFSYFPPGPFDFPIDVSFWAQLSLKTDDNFRVIETFSRSVDNLDWATLWLYSS